VLASRGFVNATVHLGARVGQLLPLPDVGEEARILNSNLAQLDQMLFGPVAYAVVASR
jgi:hypothetical protein